MLSASGILFNVPCVAHVYCNHSAQLFHISEHGNLSLTALLYVSALCYI